MDMIGILVLGFIVLLLIVSNIKIVPQAYVLIIERLGAYHASWGTGLHFAIPLADRVSKKVSLKELVADFPPHPVITKDNVTMQIDTVIY
ncbi:MAG: SPFH domain-containing protein, partial [Anaerotignaceae bacterium]